MNHSDCRGGHRLNTTPIKSVWRWLMIIATAALAAQLVLLFVGFTRYPSPGGDDIWSASTAYTYITRGIFGRSLNAGAYGSEMVDYFPPGNILLLIGSYHFFGFGVWQTKIVALIFGMLTLGTVSYTVWRLTGSRLASFATAFVLAFSIPATLTWLNGRYDSPSIFFATLALSLSLIPAASSRALSFKRTFAVGLATGLAIITYYPFFLLYLALPTIALLLNAPDDEKKLWIGWRKSARALTGMLAGGLVVAIPFARHVLRHFDLFRQQIVDLRNFYHGSLLGNLIGEWHRYYEIAVQKCGVGELLLFALAVAWLGKSKLPRSRRWSLIAGVTAWVIYLATYGHKYYGYVAFFTPVCAIALGVAVGELAADAAYVPRIWKQSMIAAGVITIVLAFVKIGLVGSTLILQWNGRDYQALSRQLREYVPTDAHVISTGRTWYALVERVAEFRSISQGGPQTEYFETPWLNDPQVLDRTTHIILHAGDYEDKGKEKRFSSLKKYIDGRFARVAQIRIPFRALPWAAQNPYDVDVYARISVAESNLGR